MPRPRLVADVTREHTLVGEAGCQGLGMGEVTSAIVAHVKDKPMAECQRAQAFVEVAFANAARE